MTLDITSHCLCVDDGIYHIFVSHNLGSHSAIRGFKCQIPILYAHIANSHGGLLVGGRDVNIYIGQLQFSVLPLLH